MSVGEDGKAVATVSESAIIVWDEKSHTERFLRIASFDTEAKDLGFLVPTPTQPNLEAAKTDAFDYLRGDVAKRHVSIGCSKRDSTAAGSAEADSPVISESHVGGFDISVLSLARPKSVEKWLSAHKFPVSAATAEWLTPYAAKNWVITAFQVDASHGAANLKPVMMTFATDRPFYPYREPKQRSEGLGRSLEVFFLADGAYSGSMNGEEWVATESASDNLAKDEVAEVQGALPGVDLADTHWLTGFMDTSNPRVGTGDVYFTPIHQIPRSWVAVALVCFIAVFILVGRSFARKAEGRALKR